MIKGKRMILEQEGNGQQQRVGKRLTREFLEELAGATA
jgi:hypothetical protein